MKIYSYKRDGRTLYKFRAYLGRDMNGKEIKVMRSGFDTKKEAQLAYAALLADYRPKDNTHLTFGELYSLWLSSYRQGVKTSTLRQTETVFNLHILPRFGNTEIKAIKPIDCQRFMDDMTADAAAGATRFIYFAKVLEFAVDNELLTRNPAAHVKRPKKRNPATVHGREVTFYTKEQLIEFLRLCREKLPPLWAAFFRLLAYSGMRRGEALALTWNDLTADTVRVNKTIARNAGGLYVSDTPKTDKSNRVIYLDAETVAALKALPHTSDLIFPNTRGGIMAESLPVKKMHLAVDGSELPYISPHGLRHTHCSLLFSAGASIPEVQERLGHSDVKTTIEIYNHIYKDDKKRALNKFIDYMDS